MPITVARIENLFWVNNFSYKKPNALPEFKEVAVIRRRPEIYDFMGGRTHLLGDQWNYAIYEGTYYFLKIDRAYDLKKGHFSYVMIRDIWMNIILKFTVAVKGRLTATKRDEWLIANLNRTYPILADPVEVTRLELLQEDFELTKHANIRLPYVDLRLPYLSKREIEDFKEDFRESAQIYKKNFENKHISNNKSPIFIFGSLKGNKSYVYSWKENLKKRLTKYLEDFKNQQGKIFISKVSDSFGMNQITGKFCITWNEKGIGVGKETVILNELNFSNLIDIIPLNISNLKPFDSSTGQPYMREVNEALFEEFRDFQYKKQQQFKFRRKIYFPITQNEDTCGIAISTQGEDQTIIRDKVNWRFNCPQKLETEIGTLFLNFVSNIDFSLDYNWEPQQDYFKTTLPNVNITWPYPLHSYNDVTDIPFWKRSLKTDLGFLIFNVYSPDILDGYKCINKNLRQKLRYISGLKKSTLQKISSGSVFDENSFDLPFNWFKYKTPVNANWRRYWHNLTSGLELLLLPNQKGYSYAYRAYNPNDSLSNNYTIRILQSSDSAWKGESPFKDEATHIKTLARRDKLIKDLTMRTLIELPLPIIEGDYLFNDLEYWLGEIDFKSKFVKGDEAKGIPYITSVYDTNNILFEDFITDNGNIPDNLNQIVICNNEEGKFEIRTLQSFSLVHKLHGGVYSERLAEVKTDVSEAIDSFTGDPADAALAVDDLFLDEQGLYSVDEVTSKKVSYALLKKIPNSQFEDVQNPLNDRILNIALNKFLELNNYIVSPLTITENKAISKVLWFKDSDFDGVSPLLFDLKGTDWYLFIKEGRISLIAKTPEIFYKTTGSIQTLAKNEKLSKLSVIEKINQKCILNVYTQERELKTRFNFEGEKFNLTVSSIKPSESLSPNNYFFLSLRSDFDVIEKDIIAVPKEQLASTDVSDYIEFEQLKMTMLRSDRDYQRQMEKNVGFQTERLNEEFRRAQWDLEIAKCKTWVNGILGFFNLATSAGTQIGAAAAAGPAAIAAAGVNVAIGAARNISTWTFANMELREKANRIATDKKFAFRELAYQSLQISLSHRDVQEDSIRRLNKVAHLYQKGAVNNTKLIEEFKKDAKITGSSYLTIFTPSREQLKLLEAHKEEFGVDCDIPSAIVEIKEGMSEEVIKFKNLEDNGVVGLPNILEREYLISVLEKGVKVVDVLQTPIEDFNEYVCTNIKQLSRELEQRRIQTIRDEVRTGELARRIKELEMELSQRANLTPEQLAAKEAELARTKSELEKINKDNEEKDKKVKELADKLELLDRQIKQKSTEFDNKNNEYLNAIEEVKKLKTQVDGYKKMWDAELAEKGKIQQELNKCKEDAKVEAEKVKQTIIATENAFNERVKGLEGTINDLKTKVGDKENTISNLETELNKAKADAKKQCPSSQINVCELLRNLSHNAQFDIDLKPRDNGFSAFTDLCFTLGWTLFWIRASGGDQHLAHYPQVRRLILKLFEIENLVPVSICEEIIQMPGYKRFTEWLEKGGNKNGEVDKVIAKTNELKAEHIDMAVVHSLWALLDEAIYLSFIARKELSEQIKTDPDLENFFLHYFPGQKILDLYKKTYDIDPKFAITKKEFLKTECIPGEGGKDSLIWVDDHLKDLDISIPKTEPKKKQNLPSTAPTLRFSDGGEVLLDETMIYPWFFPNARKLKATTYIDVEGNIGKSSIRGWALKSEKTNKYPYARQRSKYTWETWTTQYFQSDIGWTGSSNTQNFTAAGSQGIYVRCREASMFRLVHSNRKQHWKNRDKIKLPKMVQDWIAQKLPVYVHFKIRNPEFQDLNMTNSCDITKNEYVGFVDIVKMFGNKADLAIKLMLILSKVGPTYSTYPECRVAKSDFDSMPNIDIYYYLVPSSDADYQDKKYWLNKYSDTDTNIEGLNPNSPFYYSMQFLDLRSLMNYVWYHIKYPETELLDIFSLSTQNLNNLARKWKIQTD